MLHLCYICDDQNNHLMIKGTWNSNDFPYETEQIKVTSNALKFRINVYSGEENGYFICIAPSVNVSAYGATLEEAKKEFDFAINVFADDIISLSSAQRTLALKKIGWQQQAIFKKQFSRAYVDEDGILKNLKNPMVSALETEAA